MLLLYLQISVLKIIHIYCNLAVYYYAKEYYDGIIAIREEFCIRPVQLRFTAIMLCFAMLFIALIGADGRILSSDRSGKGVM